MQQPQIHTKPDPGYTAVMQAVKYAASTTTAEEYRIWLKLMVTFFESLGEPKLAEEVFQLWQQTINNQKAQHDRQSAGGSPATSPSASLASQLKCTRYPNCECTDGCIKPYRTTTSGSGSTSRSSER